MLIAVRKPVCAARIAQLSMSADCGQILHHTGTTAAP